LDLKPALIAIQLQVQKQKKRGGTFHRCRPSQMMRISLQKRMADLSLGKLLVVVPGLEAHGLVVRHALHLDFAVLAFETFDVFLQKVQKLFGVLGCADHAGVDSGIRNSGQDATEVHDKFGGGIGDDEEIRVGSLAHFFVDLDIDLAWLFRLVHVYLL